MGRKVFISFLGSTNYGECYYTKNGFISSNVRFIQEATLKYLTQQEEWTAEDVVYILLTQGAKEKNWKDKEHDNIIIEGLDNRLKALSLSCRIETISNLPDGNNETEIWTIFERVFEHIEDDDSLYFDITHGFRYLPMLTLVLGNYTKFLKKTKVKSITYGNYESRDKKNHAPIIDLLPLTVLQDWTFAAANYLENGNVKKMVSLSREKITPILALSLGKDTDADNLRTFVNHLETVIEERRTCRGIDIYKSKNFAALYDSYSKIDNCLLKPLQPILNKIEESFENFDINQNIKNGFAAARWCYNFGMYQQAATILQENIVSWFCLLHDIKIDNEEEREIINKAFVIKNEHIEESKWKIEAKHKEKLVEVLNDAFLNKRVLIDTFGNLTEVRNDFNHSGMRSKRIPLNPQSIIKNIEKCLNNAEKIFLSNECKNYKETIKNKLLINLSNHPSSTWSETQRKTAIEQFGEVIDIPFPEIEPEWDSEKMDNLVEIYLEKILSLGKEKNAQAVVHLMGEYVFCFKLTTLLKENGITVVVSTSERHSVINADGTKTIQFDFVRFRNY